jgi:hypothetical protein
MTAKKTTTTKTVEKEIKNSADEVKATTSTKATASAKTTKASKKMTKEELVEKAMASAKAKKEAEKPVEEETTKATKATVKKPKTTKKPKAEEVKRVLFLDSMSIKGFGDLQRVKTEDWEELKELFHEGAVILTAWNKKTIRNYDGCTPGVKVNDLYAYDLSDRVYDVVTPIYTKSTSEQVIAVSNYTEAAFIFYQFEVLDDAKYGEYRQSSDLLFEVYMPKKQQ